jgi:hypothetical protein
VLVPALRAVLPAGVTIVDSAASVAAVVAREAAAVRREVVVAEREVAAARRELAPAPRQVAIQSEPTDDEFNTVVGRVQWLATDGAQRFARVSSVFLGTALRADEIEIIDL